MSPILTNKITLIRAIRNSMFVASQAMLVVPPSARASHIRIRSHNAEQFSLFSAFAHNPANCKTVKTVEHKGKHIIFCQLRTHGFSYNGKLRQIVRWLEFTAPREDHSNGPDALVFKDENCATPYEEQASTTPLLHFRFQSASAEDIVNR